MKNEIRVGGKSILKKAQKAFKKQWKVWHASNQNERRNLATGIIMLAMSYFYLYYNVIYQAQSIFSIFFKKPFEFDWKQGTCCKDGQLW